MARFTLSPPTPDDFPRLAEIAHAAFLDDDFSKVAFKDVSKEDNIAWSMAGFEKMPAAPGEIVCARDPETGEIVGWARWAIPVEKGTEEQAATAPPPLPKGLNTEIWSEFQGALQGHQARIMEGRPHWSEWPTMLSRYRQRTRT
jgi:hypothetical protein